MSGILCDASGCTNPIMRRCSQCQGSYCLRHMAQGQTLCDMCIATKRKAGGALMKWGCLTTLGGMLLLVIGEMAAQGNFTPLLPIASWIAGIGFVVFIVGLVKKD